MIRKLENVFAALDNYNCFACGPDHPFGLRMEFFYDDTSNEVYSTFIPSELFAGFPGVLHGGIQATLLDEVAFWGAWARYHIAGFTYNLNLRYKKKCPVDQPIEARGTVGALRHHLVTCDVRLWMPETRLIFTRGTVTYFLPG